jgi:hypothetical protein
MDGASSNAPAFSLRELIVLACGVAWRSRASGPISIQHTSATRGQANQVLAPPLTPIKEFDSDAPCYVVLIQGTFNPPARPGASQPRRPPSRPISSITLIVHAVTGRIMGSRSVLEGGPPPDLAAVGPVTIDATRTTALDDWSPWSRRDQAMLRDPKAGPGHGASQSGSPEDLPATDS